MNRISSEDHVQCRLCCRKVAASKLCICKIVPNDVLGGRRKARHTSQLIQLLNGNVPLMSSQRQIDAAIQPCKLNKTERRRMGQVKRCAIQLAT